jgi:FeS assembly protein IscX
MPKLTWNDLQDIALALSEKYPDQDPSYIRFTDLHKWITELDQFGDDPKKSNEANWRRFRRRGWTSTGTTSEGSAIRRAGTRALRRGVCR